MNMLLTMHGRAGVLALAGCALLLPGCTGGENAPERYRVRGTVTLDGEPVADGEVLFLPDDGTGRPDAGRIVDGKFECRVTAGNKQVEVIARRKVGEEVDPTMEEYGESPVAVYDAVKKTLTAEVSSDGENTYSFELQSE